MNTLIVVKAGVVGVSGILLPDQAGSLDHLGFSLLHILMQEGVETAQVLSGNSGRCKASAAKLAFLSKGGYVRPSENIDTEFDSTVFPRELSFVQSYDNNDAVILVCEGNMADKFPSYYGQMVLGIDGLDDDAIIPTCSRMLNCQTGQLALVY